MDYTTLISGEHRDKPNFTAIVTLLTSGSNDAQVALGSLQTLYNLDGALGVQLDAIGRWVGFGRYINIPGYGAVTLIDSDYRTLLRAKILANHWNGQMDTLQVILASLFPGTGITLFAVDNQDMSMDLYLTGGTLSAVQLALLNGHVLVPKPEGVRINGIVVLTGPLFGLDYENASVAGFDVGAFITYL